MSDETEQSSKDDVDNENDRKSAESSVKKGSAGVLILILISLAWYLAADRYTPYTQQARVQGFVVGVAPKVSGLVTSVHVKNNQTVKAGEPLFEIDRSSYEITLKRTTSDLENTRKQVSASAASIETARANLRAAEANEVRAEKDAMRQERLYADDEGTISLRRLEMARASYEQARAKVTAAESEVQRAIEQMGGEGENNAKLKAAESAVEQAELDLPQHGERSARVPAVVELVEEVAHVDLLAFLQTIDDGEVGRERHAAVDHVLLEDALEVAVLGLRGELLRNRRSVLQLDATASVRAAGRPVAGAVPVTLAGRQWRVPVEGRLARPAVPV